MRTGIRGVVIVILAAAFSGCNTPTSPSTLSLDGMWMGTVSDGLGTTSSAGLMLSQSGTSLSGIFTTNFDTPTTYSVTGYLQGAVVSLTLTPDGGGCPWAVALGVTGSRMKGTAGTLGCATSDTSMVELAKR